VTEIGPTIGIATPSYVGVPGAGAGPPPAVWVRVAMTGVYDSTPSPAINTTGADLLVAVIAQGSSPVTITDSAANTWVTAVSLGNETISYVGSPTTSATHTFSLTNPNGSAIAVLAYSGSRASPLDQTRIAAVTTGAFTSQPGVGITPTANNELIINGGCFTRSIGSVSIDSGLTVRQFLDGRGVFGFFGAVAADFVQPTAGLINPTMTTTLASQFTNYNAIASFFHA